MLKLENISLTFGKGSINEKQALKHISLTLEDDDFVTVIGSNGAGKSTMLNVIAGVYESDEGKIWLDDMNMTFWPEYKRSRYVGRVFQNPLLGTAYAMTIEENLAMALMKDKSHGLQPGVSRKESEFLKEQLSRLHLGLEDRMKHKVGLLSGGQRQALTMLMATLVMPKLLLLDEHTAALDPGSARQILQLTDEIVRENRLCTLMVTHNMQQALSYGNRTIMMHEGEIVLDIKGKERENMTVEKMIDLFSQKNFGQKIESDRMLLQD